ncbi:MAG: RluA family pseudouridine synthase [Methylocystis sp.]|nr:RluA family pseudouridine synthase [Methylocystis sp.]MCA3582113.1 RluA family pseudouridine synthase [Methylocystis sp.]MCA3586745.1 RluA family pseudouridine synthase [Methylocystis sp.]MCA3590994.1 RluA family pseudouridine synthase [Methylocystis sp.]
MSGVFLRTVGRDEGGMRLDRWFKINYPDLAFGHLQKILRSGQVRLDGKRVKGDVRIETGQQVRIPPFSPKGEAIAAPAESASRRAGRPDETRVAPSLGRRQAGEPGYSRGGETRMGDGDFLRSLILYEDSDVFVFNKPFGLAVQGGSGLTRHLDGMLPALASQRGDIPRLVHRLDRDTTGVLVVARTRRAAAELGAAFRSRSTKKIYWALCAGVPRVKQGRISTFLAKGEDEKGDQKMKVVQQGGEATHSLTYYAVVDQSAQKLSWLSLRPVTGRTHQLRVHTAEMGHPIVGDPKYFNVENWELPGGIQKRLHLHARRLMMPLPSGKLLDVTAPLPQHMQQTWNLLGLDAKQYDPIEDAPEK